MQIVMENVCKTYERTERPPGFWGAVQGAFVRQRTQVRAVDDVSFGLREGELVGYIGPNGAGKSTTVKLMSGILVPDSGRVEILGRVPWKERRAHVASIGVVFGQRSQLWWDTPVMDSFDLLRDIYKVSERDYRARLHNLVDLLEAEKLLKIPVRQLSLGQRMKCELIAALIHAPKILFLDEPTIGLDAVTKLGLRSFLTDLNQKQNVTMILTTHDMDDIEALCRRVMVIGHGKLLFDGALSTLRAQYAPYRIVKARLRTEAKTVNLNGVERVEVEGRDVRILFHPGKKAPERVIAELAAAHPIADLTLEEPDIEQLVADLYKEMRL